jgi:RNA polymerase sigma-70 factor (ECF subfamily)
MKSSDVQTKPLENPTTQRHVATVAPEQGGAFHRDEDDQLMYQIQGGDRLAFERLLDRYQASLAHFFFRHLRDWQLAEDLTQETLIRVYNTAWDYLPRGCFKGWMFRIARNLMIDSTRRRSHDALVNAGRTQRPDDDDGDVLERLAGDFVLPEDKADQNEFAKIVSELLPKIPEEQRLTFMMHHYSGLSLPEVADAMESNLPTTKSRLRLAREKLRELLAARGIVDPNQSDDSSEREAIQ